MGPIGSLLTTTNYKILKYINCRISVWAKIADFFFKTMSNLETVMLNLEQLVEQVVGLKENVSLLTEIFIRT